LRIGLMLDLGVGQALERQVRDIVVKAARAFEAGGAEVTEVPGVLTREMLDGLDAFWRARSWDDLSRLAPQDRAKALPYIYKWAEGGAKLSGVDVVRGFNATMAIRAAAAKLFCNIDYVISPVSPVVNFAAELASPINDPQSRSSTSATPCHGTWRKIRRPRSTALRHKRLSNRGADHRAPFRRYRRIADGESVRRNARPAEAMAGDAE